MLTINLKKKRSPAHNIHPSSLGSSYQKPYNNDFIWGFYIIRCWTVVAIEG